MTTDPTNAIGFLLFLPAWGISLGAICYLAHRGYLKATDWLFYSENKTN